MYCLEQKKDGEKDQGKIFSKCDFSQHLLSQKQQMSLDWLIKIKP